eukprot:jgi/Tetstr1/435511/TSEL_024415.t1
MVGIFIISIPQNIICIFKFAIIGTLKLIVLLPPTLWLLTLYIQMIVYSGIMRRAFMKFMFYTVLGGILSAFAPAAGGLICKRTKGAVPRRCPRAFVTLSTDSAEKTSGPTDTMRLSATPGDRESMDR